MLPFISITTIHLVLVDDLFTDALMQPDAFQPRVKLFVQMERVPTSETYFSNR